MFSVRRSSAVCSSRSAIQSPKSPPLMHQHAHDDFIPAPAGLVKRLSLATLFAKTDLFVQRVRALIPPVDCEPNPVQVGVVERPVKHPVERLRAVALALKIRVDSDADFRAAVLHRGRVRCVQHDLAHQLEPLLGGWFGAAALPLVRAARDGAVDDDKEKLIAVVAQDVFVKGARHGALDLGARLCPGDGVVVHGEEECIVLVRVKCGVDQAFGAVRVHLC